MDRLKIDLTKYLENTALIHCQKDSQKETIKYKDLLKQTLKVKLLLEDESVSRSESATIGILCNKTPAVFPLILAILEADLAFCFISEQDVPHELDKLGIKYFFCDEVLFHDENVVKLRNSLDVFGTKIRLYKATSSEMLRLFSDSNDPMNRICYTITTSGTTGQRKIVRVTFNCITPNVVGLQQIFRLHKDVIYSSAPCTFDVFVLDFFLALHSGSALMLMDGSLRYSDDSLDLMFSPASIGVTFLQITPSLFQQYGIYNIHEKILHPNSSLKYLVLGGEQFPATKEVATWQNWESAEKKRLFNIYGTTEVSCWATIHEVTKKDLELREVPLGKLLDQTSLAFQPDISNSLGLEELIITSTTRVCYVDDKKLDEELGKGHLFAQATGDLVRRVNDQIFFYGRKNDILKKFGERVDLNKIELTAQEVIQAVACIYMKKKIVLFYKIDDHQLLGELKSHLKAKLKPSEVPDDFRKISFFPLSKHGKVSKEQLKDIYKDLLREDRERRIEAEDGFLEAINQILNLKLGKSSSTSDEPDGKRLRTDMDSTFKALGGTSFDALRISMRLEDQTGLSNGLLPKLLGDRHSIRDICRYLKDLKPYNTRHLVTPYRAVNSNVATEITCRFDLKKCIDASPAFVGNNFISVGSHSHELITLNAKSFKEVSRTKFGDRIESEVAVLTQEDGVVGCYDGNLYCFNFTSGAVKWKFNSHAMIKSRALVVDELVIFGNYNYEKNLWCLQVGVEVTLKWNRLVGSRGILAAPLLLKDSIIICTLDGTIESIRKDNGVAVWSKNLESPIFSSPQQIPGRSEVLVAEVSKKINCIDFDGNLLWNFETEGHIFSSFLFSFDSSDDLRIYFGCHDKNLRCLSYKNGKANLVWSTELQSQIYGTPVIATKDHVVSCTTSGFVYFIKLSNGVIEHTRQLPGEIFSTPLIHDRNIFIGCRDNFLYCLKF